MYYIGVKRLWEQPTPPKFLSPLLALRESTVDMGLQMFNSCQGIRFKRGVLTVYGASANVIREQHFLASRRYNRNYEFRSRTDATIDARSE